MLGRYEENAYFWRMMRVAGHPDVRIYEFDGFDHGNMPQAGTLRRCAISARWSGKWSGSCVESEL